jgi:hypothetical protein
LTFSFYAVKIREHAIVRIMQNFFIVA